jgi:hypothetical protein
MTEEKKPLAKVLADTDVQRAARMGMWRAGFAALLAWALFRGLRAHLGDVSAFWLALAAWAWNFLRFVVPAK